MSKLNALMERFKSPKKDKMNALVNRSHTPSQTGFEDVFPIQKLPPHERESLQTLLEIYQNPYCDVQRDLDNLSVVTSEVKVIRNQAVLLHGERIKKVQYILKSYKEGAFSSWLLHAYGNRQTPYNFLQYFELYHSVPIHLKPILDEMPRQAIYVLSSRSIPQEKKEAFIKSYRGETKNQLLEKIRLTFPLNKRDKRGSDKVKEVYKSLKRAASILRTHSLSPSKHEKASLQQLLSQIKSFIH